jgi:hypothetical protein
MRTTWMVAVLATGCGFETRVELEVPVRAGSAGDGAAFEAGGGAVTLSEATITFADLRLEEPPETDVAAILQALSPISVAHAHPGHDFPGAVGCELLGSYTVDLLAEASEIGAGLCYSGAYATGRVALSGAAAVLAGTWDDGAGDVRPFRFEVPADQEIVGIPFEVTIDPEAPPEAIALAFDPALALAFVDWADPDSDGDGVLTLADDPWVHTVAFGVVSTPSWSLAAQP